MSKSTTANFEQVQDDIQKLQADILSLTKAISGDVKDGVDTYAKVAGERLDHVAERAKRAGQESQELAVDTVKSNPLASLAAALGVGFVVGALLKR